MKKWQEIKSNKIFTSKIISLEIATRINPRNNTSGDYYIAQFPDWVNVVALTDKKEIVLVRQYRHGSEKFEIELPGGCIEQNEDPITGGLRELQEETGYKGISPKVIGSCNPNPAIQNNTCFTVLVEKCSLVGSPSPDEGEDIEVFTVPTTELEKLIQSGKITNSLIISAIYFLNLYKR